MLAEEEVDLWKCSTKYLMSEEGDGGVSRWIVRPLSFCNQELTAVEIRGQTEVQGNAPRMSAKWTKFRQNAASYKLQDVLFIV